MKLSLALAFLLSFLLEPTSSIHRAEASMAVDLPLPQNRSSLSFRFEPFLDLYFLLRKAAAGESTLSKEWNDAVDAMRRAAVQAPSPAALLVLDGIVAEHRSARELRESIGGLPEMGPGGMPLRKMVEEVIASLEAGAPIYTAGPDSSRRAIVEAALHQRIEKALGKGNGMSLDPIRRGLEIEDPGVEIPIFLVADAPDPGGVTLRSRRLGAFCVVAVAPHKGTTLYEVIVHEASHVLDVTESRVRAGSKIPPSEPGGGSVLDRLRKEMEKTGVKSTDPLYRDLPHTILFVLSAEAVRKWIDPRHVDYGDSNGYYAKVDEVAAVVREQWPEVWRGELDSDVAIDRTIAEVMKRRGLK